MVEGPHQIVPSWLKSSIDRNDLDAVRAAIHSAETSTDGEIVPIIVHRSVSSAHIGTISVLSLWFLATAFALVFELHTRWLPFAALLGAVTLLGMWLGTLNITLRILTPTAEIDRAVWQRAKAEFLDEGIGRTKRATGVLLFLSMAEHRAIVLADRAISAKFTHESWQQVCDLMVAGLRDGNLRQGLVQAIELSGQMMATHFPPVDVSSNQLADRLIIRD